MGWRAEPSLTSWQLCSHLEWSSCTSSCHIRDWLCLLLQGFGNLCWPHLLWETLISLAEGAVTRAGRAFPGVSVEFIISSPSSHLALGISRSQSLLWEKVKPMDPILKVEELRHKGQQPQTKSPHGQLAGLRTQCHRPQAQPSAPASPFPSSALGWPVPAAVRRLRVEGAVVMDTASTGCAALPQELCGLQTAVQPSAQEW